ncbi:GRAM domain-containing protein 2B [Chanos chanos]|uniref:GRAM domain-containing protein 2B n=1 Tax=Chanos chanos TaxID=29144 RepID=A0A6J2VE55_CHACN|nr:GRAM domain-containing protein 2B-like [Chanos chanos]
MNGIKKSQRKFSLDSSGYSLESGGHLGKTKSRKFRRSSEDRKTQSLEEAQLEFQELNRNQHRHSLPRTTTIEEEGFDRTDGSVNRNSFKNHTKTFHKIFPEIPEAEELTYVCSCALQKEVLYQGKLFVSDQHVSFHSSVLLKETKVVIPVSTIQTVKKKHTARVVPNALAIITNAGEKHLFVSFRGRDVCFRHLQSVCPQLLTASANGSPQMSPVENSQDLEIDTISNQSSQEDVTDHNGQFLSQQNLSGAKTLPLTSSLSDLSRVPTKDSSTPRGSTSRDEHSSEEKEETAVSRVSMVTKKVKSFLSMRESNSLNSLLIIYLILVVLLLLSSGYIGLRIVALEEQLRSLGSMVDFGLPTE